MSDVPGCVDEDELARLATAQLSPEETAALEAHAEACARCAARVSDARKSVAGDASKDPIQTSETKTSAPKVSNLPPHGVAEKTPSAPFEPYRLGVGLFAALFVAFFLARISAPPEIATSPSMSEESFVKPTIVALVTSAETAQNVRTAFEKASAPRGTDAATLALLRAAAEEVESAFRDLRTTGDASKRRGEIECLTYLASDIEELLTEATRVSSRTAAEGLVLAARELEHPAVCRGAATDPVDAGREKPALRTLMNVRMRRPMAVAPVVAGPFDAPSKRALFILMQVVQASARSPQAFPDDAQGHAFDSMFDSMLAKVDDPTTLKRSSADELTRNGLAAALAGDGAAPVREPPMVRAIAFAEALSMPAFRTRFSIVRAEADPAEARAQVLGDLLPLVQKADDPHTSALFTTARLRLDAARGIAPPKDTTTACASRPAMARASCLPILEAVGDVAIDRDARDVDLETTTANATYGEDHPHAAFALVHAAEWQVAHGELTTPPPRASPRERAEKARQSLEASLLVDEGVDMGLARVDPIENVNDGGAALGPWKSPLHVGEEASAKYMHLARAYAVLVATLPEALARTAALRGRRLRGRDPTDAVLLPLELAVAARFPDPRPAYDFEKAATSLRHPRFTARALARLAASEANEDKARVLYARALVLVAMLPPRERASLRLGAARKVKDKTVARSLLEKALVDAGDGADKPAIEALLRLLPDTPSVHGSRP